MIELLYEADVELEKVFIFHDDKNVETVICVAYCTWHYCDI
jgi:hypothetical protein